MSKPRKQVIVQCDHCGKNTSKANNAVSVARKHGNKMFCSRKCFDKHRSNKINCVCKNCGEQFIRDKSQVEKSKNTFCSQSCAAIFNNKKFPKRKNVDEKDKYCSLCGKPKRSVSIFCQSCSRKIKSKEILSTTLGQIRNLYREKSSLDIAGKLRGYSRQAYKQSNQPKRCANCGYDKHYEVCHIKPIKDFSNDATMQEIHDISNLVALCRNCHWELDHGMLRIEDIVK
jgi:hypothetical protein